MKAHHSATFRWKFDSVMPPQSVYLFEYTDITANPWAYWAMVKDPVESASTMASLADQGMVEIVQ